MVLEHREFVPSGVDLEHLLVSLMAEVILIKLAEIDTWQASLLFKSSHCYKVYEPFQSKRWPQELQLGYPYSSRKMAEFCHTLGEVLKSALIQNTGGDLLMANHMPLSLLASPSSSSGFWNPLSLKWQPRDILQPFRALVYKMTLGLLQFLFFYRIDLKA